MAKSGKYLFGLIVSFCGFVFLSIIGALLKLQPKFIHGAKNPKSTSNACFEAAGVYALATAGCFVMYKRGGLLTKGSDQDAIARDRAYREFSDSEEGLPLALHMSPAARAFTQTPVQTPTQAQSSRTDKAL